MLIHKRDSISPIFFRTHDEFLCTFASMAKHTEIRIVTPQDAAQIAAIYNEYVLHTDISFETEPLSADEMRGRIESISANFPYYVYEEDGRVLGYCYAHPWKERAAYSHTLETTIYLSIDAQGHGIGRALMNHLIEACRRAGFHALVACITGGNERSIALHRRLGFHQVSHFPQVGRKFGRWLDVVDLQMML